MKVIELLNKINNNEEVPEKVKFEGDIFTYKPNKKEYERKLSEWVSETLLFRVMNTHFIKDLLRAEVEVIEENKKIEEIGTTKMIEEKQGDLKILEELIHICESKINEIVREVNKINKEREEK